MKAAWKESLAAANKTKEEHNEQSDLVTSGENLLLDQGSSSKNNESQLDESCSDRFTDGATDKKR